jgi:hypothetical protein
MNISQSVHFKTDTSGDAEETLRVIASLPAPDGLVDRVQTRLRNAPRTARVIAWPKGFAEGGWRYGSAFRGVAAAAIVCVVVGGGWRIYSRVQPAPSARVVVMPLPASPARGFSTSGSVHTPDPLRAPVLTHQVLPEPSVVETIQPRPGSVTKMPKHGKAVKPLAAQPAASPM